MITEPLEAYRRCDPAEGRLEEWALLEPMIARRLDERTPDAGDRGSVVSRYAGASSRWWRAIVAVLIAAIALGTLVVAAGSGGDERGADVDVPATQSTDVRSSDSTATPAQDLGRMQALATDALSDDFADAINAASLDDALALLSPESDCDWPMQPDATEETCDQYWSHQIAIGAEISFEHCDGMVGRRCSVVMTSQLASIVGSPGHTRSGTMSLVLDERQRLVLRWEAVPTEGEVPAADEQRLFEIAAERATPIVTAIGRPPTHLISAEVGPLCLDQWSGEALVDAARSLRTGA